MRSRVLVLLSGLLVATLVVSAVPVGAQPPADQTRLDIQLQEDGDARWTIVATIPLEDAEDAENFRSFAETYEGGELDFRLGVDAFRKAADQASRSTGRDMAIEAPNRTAALVEETPANGSTNRYGEVRVSFTWTAFARIDENDTMYVGDAFRTENGTWLSGLAPNQTLVLRSPPGYSAPTTVRPQPDELADGNLTWRGPETFEPGDLRIIYEPVQRLFGLSTVLLAGALVLSAVALILGLYLLWRRRDDEPSDGAPATGGEGSDAPAASEAAAAAGAAEGATEDAEDVPDLELLSDEERVEYLIEENGGRMKQADIVKETGWSNAKVSQLLSSMADQERVDKLRIGRENLISLPDESIGDLDTDSEDS